MRQVKPYRLKLTNFDKISSVDIYIKGRSFLNVLNLYLSASDPNMFDNISFFSPFSARNNLYSKYPGFNAILVENFTIFDNSIIFNIPQEPKTTGKIDVIIENEAGYGKLTTDSRFPYTSSFEGAINYQFPWVDGIIIEN